MKKIIVFVLVVFLSGCSNPVLDNDTIATVQQTRDLAPPRVEGDESLPSVLLLGDSRVEGIPVGLFANEYHTTNCGVGGSRSDFVLAALMQIQEQFDAIVISTGINDTGSSFNLMQTLTNLDYALAYASVLSNHVYITTIPGCCSPGAFGEDIVNLKSLQAYQINEKLHILAAQRGATIIPLSETIGVWCWLDTNYADFSGIHYNATGYAKLHDLYVSMIETGGVE